VPNTCEIDALLAGGLRGLGKLPARTIVSAHTISDLRAALGDTMPKKASSKSKKKLPPGPSAERMLEIAEAQLEKGNRNLALAWGARAVKRAGAENKKAVQAKAEELVKMIRGQEVLKALGGLGDIDGLIAGRMMGLW